MFFSVMRQRMQCWHPSCWVKWYRWWFGMPRLWHFDTFGNYGRNPNFRVQDERWKAIEPKCESDKYSS